MILDKNAFGVRGFFAERAFKATFRREGQEATRDLVRSGFVGRDVSVYIHFPFCTGLCPACPYVRYIQKPSLMESYCNSLIEEVGMYGRLLKDLELRITDIHVGGGTPSLPDPVFYKRVLEALGEWFDLCKGLSFGIEANPEDLTEDKVFKLREAGVNELSIGVQSFFRENLRTLGRRHSVEDSIDAIENVEKAGFENVNLDMMYMIPRQTVESWVEDLELAAEYKPSQITTYPLLIVPYRPMYSLMRQGRVPEQPSMREFKQMYYSAVDRLDDHGYKPVRYYSFSRSPWEYSTVEREMVGPLLAFGAGAMGFPGRCEYVNTCSVREYVKSIARGMLPIAGIRPVSKEERGIRWIAERLSALKLEFEDFEREFGEKFREFTRRTGFSRALTMQRLMGHLKFYEDRIELTRKGLFGRNLSGWHFVLSVPCRIVEEYLRTPWPREVTVP